MVVRNLVLLWDSNLARLGRFEQARNGGTGNSCERAGSSKTRDQALWQILLTDRSKVKKRVLIETSLPNVLRDFEVRE